jgi:hypothetical protein
MGVLHSGGQHESRDRLSRQGCGLAQGALLIRSESGVQPARHGVAHVRIIYVLDAQPVVCPPLCQ